MKKDWRNLSDKELDEVFRQASKHPSLPFNQKDWEMMQEKLDNTVWIFPIHRVWTWGLFLGLLLLAVLHFIEQEKEIYNREYATYSEEHIPPTSLSILSDDDLHTEKILIENRQITAHTASPSRAESFRTITITPIELPEMDTKHLSVDLKDHFIGDQQLHNSSDKPVTPTTINHSKFSLTLMASPDISAFKVNEINGLGNNVGVYLEYFIKSNLSIVSGATYGNKIYRTSTTYSGYYPSSSRIWDGECKVLDIPVNLRYYAINRPKDRGYVSGGMSSYYMLQEQYSLTTESGGQMQKEQIDISNKNQHLFGIINLSIGYERAVHPKWSLQIEPYVKLPLTGIGEGDINLKSTGVWIGLKHRW